MRMRMRIRIRNERAASHVKLVTEHQQIRHVVFL